MSKAMAASCSHVRPHPMKVEEGMWMSNPLFNGMFGSLYGATIIGAGVIGLELGSVWSRLGTEVNRVAAQFQG